MTHSQLPLWIQIPAPHLPATKVSCHYSPHLVIFVQKHLSEFRFTGFGDEWILGIKSKNLFI
jgi:hypothetical protein